MHTHCCTPADPHNVNSLIAIFHSSNLTYRNLQRALTTIDVMVMVYFFTKYATERRL